TGLLIGEGFERHCGHQMRRFRTETYADQTMSAGRHQCVDHGRQFLIPLCAGGQYHRTGVGNGPVFCSSFLTRAVVSKPAVAQYLEVKTGSTTEITFKRKRLFLPPPQTQSPLEWNRPGTQSDSDGGIFCPLTGKTQVRFEAIRAQPVG